MRSGVANTLIAMGAAERGGKLMARVIANTKTRTIHGRVREAVSTTVNLLATDEHAAYKGLKDDPYEFVCHTKNENVVSAAHTQIIDGFWSLLKRGILGMFHNVSVKYLPH